MHGQHGAGRRDFLPPHPAPGGQPFLQIKRQLPGGGLGEIISLALMIPSALAGKDVGGMKRTTVSDHVDKPGTSFTFKLDKPGTYEIRCLLHDGMTATIKAVE